MVQHTGWEEKVPQVDATHSHLPPPTLRCGEVAGPTNPSAGVQRRAYNCKVNVWA